MVAHHEKAAGCSLEDIMVFSGELDSLKLELRLLVRRVSVCCRDWNEGWFALMQI